MKENPSLREGKSKPWGSKIQARGSKIQALSFPRIEPFQRVAPAPFVTANRVMPAYAGIQDRERSPLKDSVRAVLWIPAYAGIQDRERSPLKDSVRAVLWIPAYAGI